MLWNFQVTRCLIDQGDHYAILILLQINNRLVIFIFLQTNDSPSLILILEIGGHIVHGSGTWL